MFDVSGGNRGATGELCMRRQTNDMITATRRAPERAPTPSDNLMRGSSAGRMIRATMRAGALAVVILTGPLTSGISAQQPVGRQSVPTLPPSPIKSPPPDAKTISLSDLAWLQGQWTGAWGTRIATQVWSAPRAGMILGALQIVADDKTTVVEFVTLTQTPTGVQYRVLRFTPSMIPWDKSGPPLLLLMSADSKRFIFHNESDSQPNQVIFNRTDPDTYVDQMLQKSSDSQTTNITFHRQKSNAGNASHR